MLMRKPTDNDDSYDDDDYVPVIYCVDNAPQSETPDTTNMPQLFVYSFLNWLFLKNKKNIPQSGTQQPRDKFSSKNLPVSKISLVQQSEPWTSGYHVIKYICVMYNQVVYDGYVGDGILPNPISSSILDKCNNDQITSILLKDLIVLTTSLYHTSI